MPLKLIPACGKIQEVKTLFSEYTDMLIAGDSAFQNYLDSPMEHAVYMKLEL